MIRPLPMRVLVLALFVAATIGMAINSGLVRSDDDAGDTPGAPTASRGLPLRGVMKDRFIGDIFDRTLAKPVSVDFTDVPILDALASLVKEYHLPLWIDKAAISEAGIDEKSSVTLRLEGVSLRTVLRLICEPLQLTWMVRDDALVVTTAVRSASRLETRIYEVGHLLYQNNIDELIEVLTSCIEPDSWDEVGGPGSVRAIKASRVLVIRQTPSVQSRISILLSEIQECVSEPAERKEPVARQNRPLTIREKLTELCEIDAEEMPLDRVMAKLASQQKIPLWIDHDALHNEGISVDEPVTIRLRGVKLESALNLILKPQKLAFVVDEDVLKITTGVQWGQSLTTRTYDVRDLVRPVELTWPPTAEFVGAPTAFGTMSGTFQLDDGQPRRVLGGGLGGAHRGGWGATTLQRLQEFDHGELINAITSTIQPDSWDEVGGPGSVREFRSTLVVRQTDEVHAEIAGLLRNLRAIRRRDGEQQPAASEEPDSMKRVVYNFEAFDYPSAELAKLIPDLIAPSSWFDAGQGGKGTLHVQPKSLVITQTRANHAEIVKLLYQVIFHVQE